MNNKRLQPRKALCAALLFLLMLAGWSESLAYPIHYHNVTIGDLRYYLSGNSDDNTFTAMVLGHVNGTDATGSLTIPSSVTYTGYELNGNYVTRTYSVTDIGPGAFHNCSGLTGSLILGNSLTTIGLGAFDGCSGFTSNLTIPNSVTTIEQWAFYGCSGFTGNLTIPNSVTTIGDEAFRSCTGFTGSLTIGNSVTEIGDCAFCDCSGFTGSLTIPNSVTEIEMGAFGNCSGFTGSLTIPNSLTTIGWEVFYGCSGFTGSLTIPSSVTEIGYGAFGNCSGFTEVHYNAINCADFLDGSDYIFPFEGCDGTLIIGENVEKIPAQMFRNAAFTGSLTIPNSVTEIGSGAFYGCSGFTGSLTIPNSVTEIRDCAFEGCSGFTGNLTIPNFVTEIGWGVFYGCSGFTGSLTIPNSVTTIDNWAFTNCSGFTGSLTLPNSVTSIRDEAFLNCSGLTGSLTIPSSVTVISEGAFSGCTGFTEVHYDAGNCVDNYYEYYDEYFFPFENCGGTLIIGENVERIPADMFRNTAFSSLTIGSSVTEIGNRAFFGCSGFTEVHYDAANCADVVYGYPYPFPFVDCGGTLIIGDNVERIPVNMFRNAAFNSLTLGNSVTEIGDNAFTYCSSFMGSLTIPNSVMTIGSAAFSGCSGFTGSLTIGNSVTLIESYAFYGCNGISSIYSYPETPPSLDGEYIFYGVNQDIPVMVPCGSENAYHTSDWGWFTNIQPFDCFYEITTTANPESGGTMSGAGTYEFGETATLTATPNEGYTFVNWTEDNEQVSADSEYSFTVTRARDLVGNFTNNPIYLTINAEANPSDGGTIVGSGVFIQGQVCTLTAIPNEDWVFINWTQDGIPVSTNATYSFIVTENAFLVANFAPAPTTYYTITVTANPTEGGTVAGGGTYAFGQTATLTATANLGYEFVNWMKNGVMVGAYYENEYTFIVTGSGNYEAVFEQIDYYITTAANPEEGGEMTGGGSYHYGNVVTLTATPNEGYSFAKWTTRNQAGVPMDVSTNSTYSFIVNNETAEAGGEKEYVAHFTQANITQTSSFTQGWNWWSTYIEQEGIDGLAQLEEGLDTVGIQIKSQQQYVNYYEGIGWMGTLENIDNESSYKIKTSAACVVEMTGEETVSASHPITIGSGWNWIGYPVNSSMSVATAFSNVTPASGDQVKAQNGYANYYDGMGWMGTLSTIEPGMGILYKSNGSGSFTLVYPTNAKGEALAENITSEHNHWVPDMHAYPDNMTVTAVVELDNEELQSDSYELAAFANGECRGSVRLMYIEPLSRHIAFLTVAGEEVETLTFSLYDTQTGEEIHGANEQINFSNNATLGDLMEPYVIRFRGMTGTNDWANGLSVYPNPVKRGEKFSLCTMEEIGEVQVEIINALGQIETLRTMSLQTTITAPNVPGVYTLRIIKEGKGTCYRKLIVR